MGEEPHDICTLQAGLDLPAVSVEVWHFSLRASRECLLREPGRYRLDLSLDRRLPGTGLCFPDHWAAHRYERAGRLFLLPPAETLRVRNGIGDQGAIHCYLPLDRLPDWLEEEPRWHGRRLEASLDIAIPAVATLMRQLGEEACRPGFASEILCEGAAMQIAVHLQRHFRGLADARPSGGLAPWRTRLIEERLRDVATAPTLAELAGLCRLSVRQLSRAFRATHGVSIGDHVAARRMDHARAMLRTQESVKAVAYGMGFATPSGFGYAFQRATGMTPGQYRTRLANG